MTKHLILAAALAVLAAPATAQPPEPAGSPAPMAEEAAPGPAAAAEEKAADPAGPSDTAEADLAAGEEIFQKNCRSCHGPKAQGMASFPRLSDKEADYLLGRLTSYKNKEKVGPNSALMYPIAAKLSEDDMRNVAAYIATSFD